MVTSTEPTIQDKINAIRDAHLFTSRANAIEGIQEAGCACGTKHAWDTRDADHQNHVFKEVFLTAYASGLRSGTKSGLQVAADAVRDRVVGAVEVFGHESLADEIDALVTQEA